MNAMEFEREKRRRRKRRENAGIVLMIFGFFCLLIGICAICWNGLHVYPVIAVVVGLMALEAVVFEIIFENREDKRS